MSDSFDTSRNQWFSVLESHFHHGPVSQYRVGTNEVWGPATPGSKYTDYYYYSSTDSFYSYTWEPDGTMHLDQVASSTLRNDGLSFTYLEWQSNSDEKAAYWGKCYWLDREKNGELSSNVNV